MTFLILFIVPFIVAVIGFIKFKKISWKEFLIHTGIQAVIALIGMAILLVHCNVWHTEIINGNIIDKKSIKVHCRHSYDCNCYTTCSTDKNGIHCTEHCSTCYRHNFDIDWMVYDNLGNSWRIDKVDSQGLQEPERWTKVEIGDPTADTHVYKNYLKATNNYTNKQYQGERLVKKFEKLLPLYPKKIYDYYNLDRFIDVNNLFLQPEKYIINNKLSKINGNLGKEKQCNIILVVVSNMSREYFYALMEYWKGANKNDIVVVMNLLEGKKIDWVRVNSLSKSNEFENTLIENIQSLNNFDADKILVTINDTVKANYERKRMRDFKYLMDSVFIAWWQYMIFIIIGLIVSGLCIWKFNKFDLFE